MSSQEGSYGHGMLSPWKEGEIHPKIGIENQKGRDHLFYYSLNQIVSWVSCEIQHPTIFLHEKYITVPL
jgi:hypothetical protein